MDEKVILQHLKKGSREALFLLWQSSSKNVLNLAFRMLKNRDDAEDILMDVFVQVPKAIQKFRGESALNTWLYKLTVNACLMKLRSKKLHFELEEKNKSEIIKGTIAEIKESNLFDKELLEKGLGALAAETRSMLWLKDAEDLDIKDLAEIFNTKEGTVKARLSRARHFVKDFIQHYMEDKNNEI